ncbi:MAG: hypothetical protein LBQ60_17560 [Bacteroidales bacterium]|nr:hypothetical protein [Bacteroidales bacterium]
MRIPYPKFLLLLLLVTIPVISAQSVDKRYLIWVSPSETKQVYGIMFNFWPNEGIGVQYPSIYGAEINLNPIGLFAPVITLVHAVFDPATHHMGDVDPDILDISKFKKINGIQVGSINMEPSVINGLDINATMSAQSKVNGISISAVMNKQYIMNGITIAPIANHADKCNGIQMGLVNTSKKLKGFQFGLWNINQKRSLPLINWSFSGKK